jgi:hypothetical protein
LLLAQARRDEPEFLERVRKSTARAASILEEVEGGDAIIAVFQSTLHDVEQIYGIEPV